MGINPANTVSEKAPEPSQQPPEASNKALEGDASSGVADLLVPDDVDHSHAIDISVMQNANAKSVEPGYSCCGETFRNMLLMLILAVTLAAVVIQGTRLGQEYGYFASPTPMTNAVSMLQQLDCQKSKLERQQKLLEFQQTMVTTEQRKLDHQEKQIKQLRSANQVQKVAFQNLDTRYKDAKSELAKERTQNLGLTKRLENNEQKLSEALEQIRLLKRQDVPEPKPICSFPKLKSVTKSEPQVNDSKHPTHKDDSYPEDLVTCPGCSHIQPGRWQAPDFPNPPKMDCGKCSQTFSEAQVHPERWPSVKTDGLKTIPEEEPWCSYISR